MGGRMKIVIISAVVIATIAVVAILVAALKSEDERYDIQPVKITKSATTVDFTKNQKLLTLDQQIDLRKNLLAKTTSKTDSKTNIDGVIRKGTVSTSESGETLFVVDSEPLQTSYRISRYVSSEEGVDIINVSCVSETDKVFKQDKCYAS